MKPTSISEKMMFNTVRLVSNDGSSGTGFFYNFDINGKTIPVIVTNKHVINNNPNATMTFHLHLDDEIGEKTKSFQLTLTTDWIFHSTKDLCFCFANPAFEHVKKQTVP